MFTDTVPATVTSLTGTGTGKKCITRDQNSELTCTFGGVPTASPLWYKGTGNNKNPITRNDLDYVITRPSDTVTVLTIQDVTDGDNGKYGCEASNTVNGSAVTARKEIDFIICSKQIYNYLLIM